MEKFRILGNQYLIMYPLYKTIRIFSCAAISLFTYERIRRRLTDVATDIVYAEKDDLKWVNSFLSNQNSKSESPSTNAINKIFRRQEYTSEIKRNNFEPVAWFETNHYNANNPIEDRHSESRIKTNNSYFFGIFDGHSGWHCSESLRLRLPVYLSLLFATDTQRNEFHRGNFSMDDLVENLSNPEDDCLTFKYPLNFEEKQTRLMTGSKFIVEKLKNLKHAGVSDSLRFVYIALDDDISKEAQPDGICDEPIWTGISGAVSVGAYIRGHDIYVANTGDCRAVIGTKTSTGFYVDIPMSEDHTHENIREVKRIQKDHPNEVYSIYNGRLLGQLQPLRSFGDVMYKWSKEIQQKVFVPLFGRLPVASHIYLTPPYLTAEPEINHKTLDKNDRFIILATDGLWDTVSSADAVKIVGQYLDDLRNGVRHQENAATKLIRHALGMGDEKRLTNMLSLPVNKRRHYHDDITVTVVYFDADYQYLKSKL